MNVPKQTQPSLFFVFGGICALLAIGILGGIASGSNGSVLAALIFGVTAVVFFVVGGQRLRLFWQIPTNPPPAAELRKALHKALQFTAEDLAANKKGDLSPSQKAKLEQQTRTMQKYNQWGFILNGSLLVIILVMTFGSFVYAMPQGVDSFGPFLSLLILVGFFIFAVISVSRQTVGWRNQAVQCASGVVYLSKESGRYGTMCILRINWKRFGLQESQLNGFWHGQRYHIYYILQTPYPIILSAEVAENSA